jgi:hypothetical protein
VRASPVQVLSPAAAPGTGHLKIRGNIPLNQLQLHPPHGHL